MLGRVSHRPDNPVLVRLRLEPAKGPDPPQGRHLGLPCLRWGEDGQPLEARQLLQQPLGLRSGSTVLEARFSPESAKRQIKMVKIAP